MLLIEVFAKNVELSIILMALTLIHKLYTLRIFHLFNESDAKRSIFNYKYKNYSYFRLFSY